MTAYSDRLAEVVYRYIPGWYAISAMALWLVLIPIKEYPAQKPKYLRISLGVFFAISCLSVPVAAHFTPLGTLLIAGLECIEIFWLTPRWKRKWKRDLEPEL